MARRAEKKKKTFRLNEGQGGVVSERTQGMNASCRVREFARIQMQTVHVERKVGTCEKAPGGNLPP